MAAYRGALFLIVLGLVPQLLCRHAELSQIHSDIGRGGSTPRADRIEPLMGVSDYPGGGRHTDERATFPVGSPGALDFQCTRSLIQLAAKAAATQHLAQNEAAAALPRGRAAPAELALVQVLRLRESAASGVLVGLGITIPLCVMGACYFFYGQKARHGPAEPQGGPADRAAAQGRAELQSAPQSGRQGTARSGPASSAHGSPRDPRPGPQLCDGLVVPAGRKCILTVKPPVMSQDSMQVVEIAGLDGEPVLRACVRHPPLWPQLGEGTGSTVPRNFSPVPSITLHEPTPVSSASGPEQLSALQLAGSAVATCFGGTTADGRRRMFMYDPYGQFAGSLARDGDGLLSRYVFATSRGDDWMALDGIFANHAVLISNRHLELLADTEPCRTSGDGTYNLRGNGGVDIGLILLCLIAIREMEAPDDS
eukprot:CAMPEP_0179184668 /NCGR_PEP_ID=MMETSP0796-20121207/91559_1 /TAXON_ID=73915 /ORGANISM="Pyrodinium bahamense, Strain pbaha01" /LENGTH=423 /DNA_ID=CAMNT_0020888607 /DNA_START=69 /DNA_END=1341 /DNA_ORIENTATION=-